MFALIVFILSLTNVFCGKFDNRIIGGKDVDIKDFPYQVSVGYLFEHTCGGSLISEKYVLTAAHCTDGKLSKYMNVRVGSSIRDEDGIVVNISKIHQHPLFTFETYDYDVSVLLLSENIKLGADAQTIPLASLPTPEGALATVSGWGRTSEEGGLSDHLKAVQVPVVSSKSCEEAYAPALVSERMICAGYLGVGGKDACQSDSGGPLAYDGKLIGIVSWGEGCARPENPGIYTNIVKVRSFIKSVSGI